MPIRFRCAYCEQLMGIARRKAGTVVNCPKCQGQVVVPFPEGHSPANPPPEHGQSDKDDQNGKANPFEQSDFSRYLKPPEPGGPPPHPSSLLQAAPPAAAAMVQAAPPPPGPSMQAVPKMMPAATAARPNYGEQPTLMRGVLLTPGLLTLVCVLAVLLMGLAFFLGLLLGKSA